MLKNAIGILLVCATVSSCGVEKVSLKDSSQRPGNVQNAKQNNGVNGGEGPRKAEPLVTCIEDNSFFLLLQGNSDEDSRGRSFKIEAPSAMLWRHPIVTELNANGMELYTAWNPTSVAPHSKIIHSRIDFKTGNQVHETIAEFSTPEWLDQGLESVLGDSVRRHAVIGNWLILSEKSGASAHELGGKGRIVAWPAASGPYWNVRSLGDDLIAWDRLKPGTKNLVEEGLGRLDEEGNLTVISVPEPSEENMNQAGMVALKNGGVLWMEWRPNHAVLVEWNPAEEKGKNLTMKTPLEGKILPTFALLNRDGQEQVAITDGSEFQFLAKAADQYEVVKRFSPRPSFTGPFLVKPGSLSLFGFGKDLFLSGRIDKTGGEWRVMAVEEARIRALSIISCQYPFFTENLVL